jgi:hypothetical protein
LLQTFKGGFPTDKVTFRKTKSQIITVLDIPESRVGAKWMYDEMILCRVVQHLELLKLSKQHYRKMVPEDLPKKIEEISMNLEMK